MTKPVELFDLQPDPTDQAAVTAFIRLTPAMDFRQQLVSLRQSGAHDLLDVMSEGTAEAWLERPVKLSGQPFLLRLTAPEGEGPSGVIRLRLQASDAADLPPTEAEVREALQWAATRFWWDLDMNEVREALCVNEFGQSLVNSYWPLRPPNMAGPWEGLLKTVISVQIFPGLAVRLQQALVEFYGDGSVKFGGKGRFFYPSVERVAVIIPEDLVGIKFSRQKARYLPAIAEMLLAQPERFDWQRLRSLPGPEAVAILDELPGVGPWTSNYVAMRGLPHPDVFIDEAGLRKLVAAGFGRGPELSGEEATRLTAEFSPHRSMACYYSYMRMYNA